MKPLVHGLALVAAVAGMAAAHDDTVTQVYEHALPNVPGKSIRALLVEYGPGFSEIPGDRHRVSENASKAAFDEGLLRPP